MRQFLIRTASVLAIASIPVPAFATVSPPPEPSHGSEDEGRQGNRFLTIFNRANSEDEAAAEAEDEDDPRSFTMPTVVAPLSSHGRLTGYAYVQLRVRVAAGHNVWDIRDDAHYALDAAVRASSRHQVSNEAGSELDLARAIAVWEAALREYYGERAIERVEIRNADLRIFRQ